MIIIKNKDGNKFLAIKYKNECIKTILMGIISQIIIIKKIK